MTNIILPESNVVHRKRFRMLTTFCGRSIRVYLRNAIPYIITNDPVTCKTCLKIIEIREKYGRK